MFKKLLSSSHPVLHEFRKTIKYLIVGGSGAVADLLLSAFLVEVLHVWYIVATTISFLGITIIVFWPQKKWTFRCAYERHFQQMFFFLLATAVALTLNEGIIYLLVERGNWHYFWAIFIAKWIVLIWNFSISRFFVFGKLTKMSR